MGPVETTPPGRRDVLVIPLVLIALFALQVPGAAGSVTGLALVFFLAWVICMTLLLDAGRGGIYRPSAMYLLVFGVFHGGLITSIAIRGTDGLLAYDSAWLSAGYTPQAVHLAIVGMVSFSVAAHMAGRGSPPVPSCRVGPPTARRPLAVIGLTLEVLGLAVFTRAVLNAGGFAVLSGGYSTYLEVNSADGALAFGTLFVGMGATCAVVAGGRARVAGWTVFITYAVVAFPIGNRGAVLFPLVALLVAEARNGRRMRRLLAATLGLTVLVAIGVVRNTRLHGSTLPGVKTLLSSPLDAIAEMGSSLHPTVAVLDWAASDGSSSRHGATLAAVPLRFLERLTGWHGGPPAHDDRLFNVEIADRVGPIGGSPIAEGYHNFGVLGVILLLAGIGMVVGWLDGRPGERLGDARLVFLVPLLIQVRNSFAPVPAQFLVALIILIIAAVCSKRSDRAASVDRGGGDEPIGEVHAEPTRCRVEL